MKIEKDSITELTGTDKRELFVAISGLYIYYINAYYEIREVKRNDVAEDGGKIFKNSFELLGKYLTEMRNVWTDDLTEMEIRIIPKEERSEYE